MSGHTLGGYHLVREIGRGGSSTVWEAEDAGGNRYALKLLVAAVSEDEQARQDLLAEVRLVNRIDSPGVAKIIDVEADASQPFIVSELVEGTTLRDVTAKSPLTVSDSATLAEELLKILVAVHLAGVAHRDLKPANIILTADGPRIIDFGIAHQVGSALTAVDARTGTAGFMAPELLGRVDATILDLQRGDWFAWAALLLSSLTGRPPFGSQQPDATIRAVAAGQADTDGLPPQLVNAFRSALHPDVAHRSKPETLLTSLHNFADGDATDVFVPGQVEPTRTLPPPLPEPAPQEPTPQKAAPQEPVWADTSGESVWAALEPEPARLAAPKIYVPRRQNPVTKFFKWLLLLLVLAGVAFISGTALPELIFTGYTILWFGQLLGRVKLRHLYSSKLATLVYSPWDVFVGTIYFLPALIFGFIVFVGLVWLLSFVAGVPASLDELLHWVNWATNVPTPTAASYLSDVFVEFRPPIIVVQISAFASMLFALLLPSSRSMRVGFGLQRYWAGSH